MNPSSNTRVPCGPKGINGIPSGHSNLFPGFSSQGKSSHHKFGKKCLRLCFGVYDSQATARQGKCKRIPLDLDRCVGSLSSPNEVSYYSSDPVAHPRIGVPTGCQVPHGGKQYLIGNQNSKIRNSCRTIQNLARIMSGPHKNNKVTYRTPGPGITLIRSQAGGRLPTIKTQRNNARLF